MWKPKITTLEMGTSSNHLSIAPWNSIKIRNFEIEFLKLLLFYFLEKGERES